MGVYAGFHDLDARMSVVGLIVKTEFHLVCLAIPSFLQLLGASLILSELSQILAPPCFNRLSPDFFKPIQFDLDPVGLAVQMFRLAICVQRLESPLALKQGARPT